MIFQSMVGGSGGRGKMASGTVTGTSIPMTIACGFKPKLVVMSGYEIDGYGHLIDSGQFIMTKPPDSDTKTFSDTVSIQSYGYYIDVTFTYQFLFTNDGLTITGTSSNPSVGGPGLPFNGTFDWFALG